MKKGRSAVITGNWKMYKTIEEAVSFVETLSPLIADSQVQVYLAVPFTAIYPAAEKVQGLKSPIVIGAQNMNDASEGAFTGEIAAKMLIDAGAKFVILGHSERRHQYGETNELVNKKVKRAISDGLQPVLCIGESESQKEKNETEQVLRTQILESLEGVERDKLSAIILAYEPVWAIGTGKVADPQDVEKEHRLCRSIIAEKWGDDIAQQVIIQYGGSVKPENASELLDIEDVDGLLVGGASLSPQSFSEIINICKGKLQ